MLTIKINGEDRKIDVPQEMPLLWALRDTLGMVGTKFGCGLGLCGACTVHVDGDPTRSCITQVSDLASKDIRTVEFLERDPIGAALQAAWVDGSVPQCGYCQGGQLMSATALLKHNANPTDAEITAAMEGNICRCGTYGRIRTAIKKVVAAGVKA